MGHAVKTTNYRTCACGKTCKGRGALHNHSKKCAAYKTRVALDYWCYDNSRKFVSASVFIARFDEFRTALIANGYLTVDGEVNYG